MKKICVLPLLALIHACTTAPKPKPVDLAAEEDAIRAVFDSLFMSIENHNIDQLAAVFTEDGVFIGTDPREVYPKDSIVAAWSQMLKMPEIPPFDHLNEPLIRIHPDGKTAIVVLQYHWKLFTPLPLRQSFGMVKQDSSWLIDFFNFSFVPYNEQIPALNEAVSEKKE